MKKIIILSIVLCIYTFNLNAQYNIATFDGTTQSVCSGTFFDNGGAGGSQTTNNQAGNYSNNLDQSITFCPGTAGDLIKITFTFFSIKESGGAPGSKTCEDFLYVYQGNTITATPDDIYCGELTGATLPVILSTSPDGCITFEFISDGNGNRGGWLGNIECVTPCQNPIADMLDLSTINICPSNATNPGSMTINVDASNSTVGNYTILGSQNLVNYDWEWGDGIFETTNTPNTTHTYASPGIYVVKLRVRDDNLDFGANGCISNNSLTRLVRILPSPDFTGTTTSPQSVNCGDNLTITSVATSQTTTQDLPTTNTGNVSLPDGNGQSYESGANYSGLFPSGATLAAGCYPTVTFDMEHSWSRDLTIDLVAPNGQSVRLFNRHGIPANLQPSYKFGTCVDGADDGVAGCGTTYTVVNSGGSSWTNYGTGGAQVGTTSTTPCAAWPTGTGVCEAGTYYKSGTYNSTTAFSTIDGAPLNGTWTLKITDNQSLDDGSLFGWTLTFPNACYNTLETVTPDLTTEVWSTADAGPAIPVQNTSSVGVTDPGPDACPVAGTCSGNTLTNAIDLGPFNGSGSFDYDVLITDEFGCQFNQTIAINVVCNLSATLSGGTSFCSNGTTNLVFSGTPNATVTYNINGGANQTIVLDALGTATLNTGVLNATTNYNLVSVTDGVTTIALSETETITINPLPTVTAVTGGNTYCAGAIIANIDVSVTGATPWTVDYTLDGVAQTINGASSPISLGNAAGVYIVTNITDANCTNTANGTQTITVNPLPTFSVSSLDPTICNAADGSFTVSGLNASTAYSITYNDDGATVGPAVINSDASGNIVFSGLNAGTYDNIIVSLSGCSTTDASGVTLANPGAPDVNDLANVVLCMPNTFTLPVITGTALTGNEAYFDGINGTGTQFNPGDIISTNMTLFIYDANGACSDQENFTLTFNAQPTVTAVSGGNTYCAGAPIANITADVTGTGPWTIDYTLNGAAQTANGASSPISLGNAAGVYVVTNVTDANCTNTANGTQTITINALPTITAVSGGANYCTGDVISNITADVTGTGPWTVDYTLNGAAQTTNGAGSPISLGNAAGVYVVTNVTDANCTNTATGTQTITINSLPTVTAVSGGNTYCAGNVIANITADVTGTGPWTIDYTLNGAPQTANGASSPVSLGNAAGVYVVTNVTDANCTNTANGTQTITINALPTITAVSGGANYCTGDVISNITADVTGTGPWTIDYTLNGAAQTANGAASPITLGNAAGVYVVTNVTDANCTNTATGTQTITINSLPTVTAVSGGNTYCAGNVIANITATTTGIGPWTIDYTLNGAPQTANGASSPVSLGNAAGVYVVTNVTDANCTNTANGTQTITINALPTVSAGANQTVCENSAVTLSGSGAVSYSWDNGVSDGVSFNATTIGATIYTVTGTDANNCQNTSQVTVNVNPLPTVTAVSGGNTYCTGDVIANITASTTGVGPFTIDYTLNGTAQTANGANSPVSLSNVAGVYVVTNISDANCTNTASGSQTITINTAPQNPSISIDTTYCYYETIANLLASPTAGATITWYSDANLSNQIGTGNSLTPSTDIGSVTYYATQSLNGCESTSSPVTVTINSCGITVPTAFTPDGDLVNDTWHIENLSEFFPKCKVSIYNRWGSLLFESEGYKEEWKGQYNGTELPVGSYFYIIEFNDGKTEVQNGSVSIIKNNKN